MRICDVVITWTRFLALAGPLFFALPTFSGQSVTLAWDPNPESNLAGYKLYFGTASRSYAGNITVPSDKTTGTITNLMEGETYYFAVTAFTLEMLESDYSEEVSYRVPGAVVTNSTPVAIDDFVQTQEDQSLNISLRATDAEGDSLTYSILSSPAKGTLTGTPPNLIYQPHLNQYGGDLLTFIVNDGHSSSSVATVRLNVVPLNDLPISQDDTIATSTGVPLTFTVNQLLANDSDPDIGDVLSVVGVDGRSASGGTIEWAGGILVYSPPAGLSGSDVFSYTVRDLSGSTTTARVHVNVTTPPDTTGPAISGWSVAGKDARSVLMTWATDEPARCVLEYGTSSTLNDAIDASAGLHTSHAHLLEWLEPGVTYYVRLRATDGAGNTSFTGMATVTTPEVVTLSWEAESGLLAGPMYMDVIDNALGNAYILSPTNGGGSVSYPIEVGVLSNYRIWCRLWAPAPGVGSFRVSVDGAPAETFNVVETVWKDNWQWVLVNGRESTNGLGQSFRIFRLVPGLHHISFEVDEAETYLDHMVLSNDPDWTPAIQQGPPVLTATPVGTDQITLTWTDEVQLEDGFEVQWSRDGLNFSPLAYVAKDTSRFDHMNLTPGGMYYYRLYAYTPWDRTEFSNISFAHLGEVKVPEQVPEAPLGLAAEVIGRRRVVLNWVDNSSNEMGFILERSTDQINFTVVQILGANVTFVEDRPPTRGWYFYRVRAFNGTGNSEQSNTVMVHVKM